MAPHGVEPTLAAHLSVDVNGYSRLMGEDEAATIRTLTCEAVRPAGAPPRPRR